MKTESELPANTTPSSQPSRRRFLGWPSTRLGWWAVGLATAFIVLFITNNAVLVPFSWVIPWRQLRISYGMFMMLVGFVSGIVGLVAITRLHERSWLVWCTILPTLFVLLFVLGEFLFPH